MEALEVEFETQFHLKSMDQISLGLMPMHAARMPRILRASIYLRATALYQMASVWILHTIGDKASYHIFPVPI